MRASWTVAIALGASLLTFTACSSRRLLMPPRLDLRTYGTIGMLEFSSGYGSSLGAHASREFLDELHSAQVGVPVLELGDQRQALAILGHSALNPDSIRAIGERHHVDVLVAGELDSSRVEPGFRIGADARSLAAGADLQAALTVRMYETRTGATVWTSTVSGSEPLAAVALAGGNFGVGAGDPHAAEERLVSRLVNRATCDLRPYWIDQ